MHIVPRRGVGPRLPPWPGRGCPFSQKVVAYLGAADLSDKVPLRSHPPRDILDTKNVEKAVTLFFFDFSSIFKPYFFSVKSRRCPVHIPRDTSTCRNRLISIVLSLFFQSRFTVGHLFTAFTRYFPHVWPSVIAIPRCHGSPASWGLVISDYLFSCFGFMLFFVQSVAFLFYRYQTKIHRIFQKHIVCLQNKVVAGHWCHWSIPSVPRKWSEKIRNLVYPIFIHLYIIYFFSRNGVCVQFVQSSCGDMVPLIHVIHVGDHGIRHRREPGFDHAQGPSESPILPIRHLILRETSEGPFSFERSLDSNFNFSER